MQLQHTSASSVEPLEVGILLGLHGKVQQQYLAVHTTLSWRSDIMKGVVCNELGAKVALGPSLLMVIGAVVTWHWRHPSKDGLPLVVFFDLWVKVPCFSP